METLHVWEVMGLMGDLGLEGPNRMMAVTTCSVPCLSMAGFAICRHE